MKTKINFKKIVAPIIIALAGIAVIVAIVVMFKMISYMMNPFKDLKEQKVDVAEVSEKAGEMLGKARLGFKKGLDGASLDEY